MSTGCHLFGNFRRNFFAVLQNKKYAYRDDGNVFRNALKKHFKTLLPFTLVLLAEEGPLIRLCFRTQVRARDEKLLLREIKVYYIDLNEILLQNFLEELKYAMKVSLSEGTCLCHM